MSDTVTNWKQRVLRAIVGGASCAGRLRTKRATLQPAINVEFAGFWDTAASAWGTDVAAAVCGAGEESLRRKLGGQNVERT